MLYRGYLIATFTHKSTGMRWTIARRPESRQAVWRKEGDVVEAGQRWVDEQYVGKEE